MNIGQELRALVEHYENLESDRKVAADDQAQILKDAKERGINTKAAKRLIKYLRDTSAANAEQAVFDDYLSAYLDFDNTPLGRHMAKASDAKLAAEGAKLVDEIADRITQEAQPGTEHGALGTAREVTDEEREAGVIAAFEGPDGVKATLSTGRRTTVQ